MSIPKEPRQLMINLMYLVLTALLALNVSAEVMNAFFDLQKSLKVSNKLSAEGVKETKTGIQELLNKKPLLKEPLNQGIDDVMSEVNTFVAYIEGIESELIDMSGNKNGELDDGDYDKFHKPKGKKNKDVTTRMLVQGDTGLEIENKVNELRKKLIDIYATTMRNPDVLKESKIPETEAEERIKAVETSLPVKIEDDWKEKSPDKTSWADYKFRQMPVAAVLPTLTKLQADARNAEANIVNKLAELVGGREIKLNKFFPVINAKKGYVIKGEKFESTVQIGAYSSEFGKNSSISVNGKSIPLKDGVGTFTETASTTGKRTLNLSCKVVNPLTGEVFTESSSFEYEVGVRSATVSADKMNVFYIGVDNPVSVVVAGVSSNDVKASCVGCNMKGSRGKYNVTASRPGDATITVSGGGFPATPFKYRVKRIPDPVPMLGAGPNKKGGAMGNGEFKAQQGLATVLEGFDFDAKCAVMGYELTRVAPRQDPVSSNNAGARYNAKSKRLVGAAKPGDTYYFDNVKTKCPGDAAGRKLPSIVFKIR